MTVWLTLLALVAFAAKSLLARLALAEQGLDPLVYTLVRVCSGAIVLVFLNWLAGGQLLLWGALVRAVYLLLYALPFSLAYVRLSTGTGALIAFAAVQLTMLLGAVARGERPGACSWSASGVALCGLGYLVLPGLSSPDAVGSAVMGAAGVGWGMYSLAGRSAGSALESSASAFVVVATVAVAPVALSYWPAQDNNLRGLGYAVFSGAVTSGWDLHSGE